MCMCSRLCVREKRSRSSVWEDQKRAKQTHVRYGWNDKNATDSWKVLALSALLPCVICEISDDDTPPFATCIIRREKANNARQRKTII